MAEQPRNDKERRQLGGRRQVDDPNYKGPERRKSQRRTQSERRTHH